jgi:hypothetical protein
LWALAGYTICSDRNFIETQSLPMSTKKIDHLGTKRRSGRDKRREGFERNGKYSVSREDMPENWQPREAGKPKFVAARVKPTIIVHEEVEYYTTFMPNPQALQRQLSDEGRRLLQLLGTATGKGEDCRGEDIAQMLDGGCSRTSLSASGAIPPPPLLPSHLHTTSFPTLSAPPPTLPKQPASKEAVRLSEISLETMGFSKLEVAAAVKRFRGNEAAALEALLGET